MWVDKEKPRRGCRLPEPDQEEGLLIEKSVAEKIRELEEKYLHEFLPEEERLELRERILKLRKKATIEAGRA